MQQLNIMHQKSEISCIQIQNRHHALVCTNKNNGLNIAKVYQFIEQMSYQFWP